MSSSRPPSLASTPATSRTVSPNPNSTRRNRTALRDYYGIKNAAPDDIANGGAPNDEAYSVRKGPLDAPDFDAAVYVESLLASEGLERILRVEGDLVGEIKGLDGERKALVYDNYSKLITATDTIRNMRTKMDPLTPTTSTLSPAVSHIAAISVSLTQPRSTHFLQNDALNVDSPRQDSILERKQSETVQWVLGTPKRLGELLSAGNRNAAVTDWQEIKSLLEKWHGVAGVEELKKECLGMMEQT